MKYASVNILKRVTKAATIAESFLGARSARNVAPREEKLYDRSMRRLRPHYLLFLQDSLAISFTHRSFSASFVFF